MNISDIDSGLISKTNPKNCSKISMKPISEQQRYFKNVNRLIGRLGGRIETKKVEQLDRKLEK